MDKSNGSQYAWYVLCLAALTFTFVRAMPRMCMPVLFEEISVDLDLSLVQVGAVWGTDSLAGLISVLAGGLLGDRFGVRKVLGIACLLAGVTGALRALSSGFAGLASTTLLFGLVSFVLTSNVTKTAGIWFSGRRLGLANGILSMGMAIGFVAGAMLSATVLSPLLGGWRRVLVLYGALSVIIGLLWFFTVREHEQGAPADSAEKLTLGQTLSRVARLKSVWLIGVALLGHTSCVQSTLGYLPLYLRGKGWSVTAADGTVAAFHGSSMLCTIPLALLSDRLRSRKKVLMPAVLITAISTILLSVADDRAVWLLVVLAGSFRDGFMAILMSMIIEVKGVGAAYAGTAIALALTIAQVGNFVGPPLGNSLATVNPGLPFVFWGALALVGPVGFYFVKEGR